MRSNAERPLKYFQNTGHISPTRAFQATVSSLDRARALPCVPGVGGLTVEPFGGVAARVAEDVAAVVAVALVPVGLVEAL